MVGLNEEMRRELAWRQYPVDQRATFFTQFWSLGAGAATTSDIPPIANWVASRHLGDNATAHGEQIVLLLRGELLRRYPNTIISAVQAQPGPNNFRTLGTTELFPVFRGAIEHLDQILEVSAQNIEIPDRAFRKAVVSDRGRGLGNPQSSACRIVCL
jgi:hypothetical protein